jgi:WD40 repeat protein
VTGEEVGRFHGRAHHIAFTPDGKHLLAIYDGPARSSWLATWDLATGRVVRQIKVHQPPPGQAIELSFAAFSPNGTRLVTAAGSISGGWGSYDTLTVRLWDTLSGKPIGYLYKPGPSVVPRYPEDHPPPPRSRWRFWEWF